MRKISLLLITVVFFVSTGKIIAQTDKKVEEFVENIENYLLELGDKTSSLHITSTLNKRKIKVKGKFDNNSKIFKQKIKYYKGGLKKEIIEIEYLGQRKAVILLKLVLINNEYFSVLKVSYSDENCTKKLSEEKLIDGKVYKKTDFDDKENETKNIYSWRIFNK